eukprot:m.232666 g.232666  ORF g.232666 m.232666 type:complete len:1227 (+) comp15237_c2_seq1:290-3970(+)
MASPNGFHKLPFVSVTETNGVVTSTPLQHPQVKDEVDNALDLLNSPCWATPNSDQRNMMLKGGGSLTSMFAQSPPSDFDATIDTVTSSANATTTSELTPQTPLQRPTTAPCSPDGQPTRRGWRTVKAKLLNAKQEATSPILKRTDNPLTSFVSRELHKYLLTVNAEEEEPGGEEKRGVVLFADASGFTRLTQLLAKQRDGAEELSRIINSFFGILLTVVAAFGGDVAKFSGDALSIVWFADPDESMKTDGYVAADLTTAALRACACSVELHKKLDMYPAIKGTDKEDTVFLRLHMGIGCGELLTVHVGGVFKRWEYILAGRAMEQIGNAEPLAEPGETCLSPEVYELVHDKVEVITVGDLIKQGKRTEKAAGHLRDYVALLRMLRIISIPRHRFHKLPVNDTVIELLRRYVPNAVLEPLERKQALLPEMRDVSVIFVNVRGVKLEGPHVELVTNISRTIMQEVQRTIYQFEGSVNKMLVDDKGVLVLCAMGLPPLQHSDDPERAVSAALALAENIRQLSFSDPSIKLRAAIGVCTGRAFCGVVGSAIRQEYTLMGNVVNLAARLMGAIGHKDHIPDIADGVVVDEVTHLACRRLCPQGFSYDKYRLKLKGLENVANAYVVGRNTDLTAQQKKVDLEDLSGREEEADQLSDMVHSLVNKQGGALVLTGDRGSGKSRLVLKLQEEGKDRGMALLNATKSSTPPVARENRTYRIRSDTIPATFVAWRSVYETMLSMAAETIPERVEWLSTVLDYHKHAVLLKNVLPAEYADPLLEQTAEYSPEDTELSFSEIVSELTEFLFTIMVAFVKIQSTMIVLHLQTGTKVVLTVDEESWVLALRLVEHAHARRENEEETNALLICVISRPLGRIKSAHVDKCMKFAASDGCVLKLGPLSEFGRLRYTAQVLTQLTGTKVGIAAISPELVQLLDDRAAGNPKHIMEMVQSLTSPGALGEGKGPAITVAPNGRIQQHCKNLYNVPVPKKMCTLVIQEFDRLEYSLKLILRATHVCKSFTISMARDLIHECITHGQQACSTNLQEDLELLVESGILRKIPTTTFVLQYLPSDWSTSPCYTFANKLMQEEIGKLNFTRMKSVLEVKANSRMSRVVRSIIRLQSAFRAFLARKKFAKDYSRTIHAAFIIQRAIRRFLNKRSSRRPSSVEPSRRFSYNLFGSEQIRQKPIEIDWSKRQLARARDFCALRQQPDGTYKRVWVKRNVGRNLPTGPHLAVSTS